MKNLMKIAAVGTAALFMNAVSAFCTVPAAVDSAPSAEVAAVTVPNQSEGMPNQKLLKNQYLQESLRNGSLAKSAFTAGNYDAALSYSEEASRYARLSDEYIKTRLKVDAANKKISEAASRLSWAETSGARDYYKTDYTNAESLYKAALTARSSNDWDSALNKANNVVEILAVMSAPPEQVKQGQAPVAPAAQNARENGGALPAQYIVRPWDAYGDCFWNIAACQWAYGNPWKWPVLYRANKAKLPNPNNPNVIEVGTILDIPSIHGELRAGMWDSGRKYSPLDK